MTDADLVVIEPDSPDVIERRLPMELFSRYTMATLKQFRHDVLRAAYAEGYTKIECREDVGRHEVVVTLWRVKTRDWPLVWLERNKNE